MEKANKRTAEFLYGKETKNTKNAMETRKKIQNVYKDGDSLRAGSRKWLGIIKLKWK